MLRLVSFHSEHSPVVSHGFAGRLPGCVVTRHLPDFLASGEPTDPPPLIAPSFLLSTWICLCFVAKNRPRQLNRLYTWAWAASQPTQAPSMRHCSKHCIWEMLGHPHCVPRKAARTSFNVQCAKGPCPVQVLLLQNSAPPA